MSDFPTLFKMGKEHLENTIKSLESQIEQEREKRARYFLHLYRQELSRYNLKRHEIKIVAGMGTCGITLDGASWEYHHYTQLAYRFPLFETLNYLNSNLEYEWAMYLDGESLA